MSQCQRCGATNEAASRFCVACGAPLPPRVAAALAPQPVQTQRPPAQPPAPSPSAPPGTGPRPGWPPPSDPYSGGGHRAAVVQTTDGPPSSSLQFAETAAPPTGEELVARRAAISSALASAAASGMIPGGWAEPGAPQQPGAYQPAVPPAAAYAPGSVPATGAMPGVVQDPEAVPEGAPRILAGFLVSYDTQPLGRFWPIYQGKNRVGRQGAAPDLDIELDHPTASSRHAVLYAAACPGRIKLEDTGSTNGTLVNGARLPVGARHELRDGDQVRFGLLSTIVKVV